MARNTALFLRIGEAKNLPAKDITGTSDPYCVVKVDNELVARTATVWKSLSPFWGEEYTLYLPNGFHQLSLYVYDEDLISVDDAIGQVTISRELVQGITKGVEKWFKIRPADKDQEVQGDLHMEICRYTDVDNKEYLKLHIMEARDLAVKDMMGAADPYVRITFLDQQKHTRKIKGSRFPFWDETFEFEVGSDADGESTLLVTVWDWDRLGNDDFMGQVELKLHELQANQPISEWFRLHPREENIPGDDSKDYGRGTLRVRARLMEERILPSQYYKSLIELLMDSVSPEKHKVLGPSPLKMLQEVMTLDLMEMAQTLVKLYLGQGKGVAYLDLVCTEEVHNTSNPNTLFRGNSLATKSVDQFMKIVGMPYLHETLGPVLEEVFTEHKAVELDPARLDSIRKKHRLKHQSTDEELLQHSTAVLLGYLSNIKDRILQSITRLPPVMRLVFRKIQQRIKSKWSGPEHEDHGYLGVSGFLFLRFLAPAILSPKLFGLQENHPDARTSRTLTLLAKTIQNLGNLGLQLGLGKEAWMQPLHPFILNSVTDIKVFIDQIVDVNEATADTCELTRRRSVFHPSVTVKQGLLWKKQWTRNKHMGSFTFKKRYFWLKFDNLSYAKKSTDPVRNMIAVPHIRAVERVDRNAFNKEHVAQIISVNLQGKTEILYIQAKDINDLFSWISSIRKTIINNLGLLQRYHAGAFRSDRWTCCHRTDKAAPGCNKSHSHATLGDWRDPLDPDAEAQTIYSQLYHGRHILRKTYLETTEAVKEAVQSFELQQQQQQEQQQEPEENGGGMESGGENQLSPNNHIMHKSTSFQDAQLASVAQLLDVVSDLEKAHDAYAKIEEEKLHGLHCNHTDIIRDSGLWEREEEEEQHLGVRFFCGDDWRTSGRWMEEMKKERGQSTSESSTSQNGRGEKKLTQLESKNWDETQVAKENDNYVTMYVSQSNIKKDADQKTVAQSVAASVTLGHRPRSKDDDT